MWVGGGGVSVCLSVSSRPDVVQTFFFPDREGERERERKEERKREKERGNIQNRSAYWSLFLCSLFNIFIHSSVFLFKYFMVHFVKHSTNHVSVCLYC